MTKAESYDKAWRLGLKGDFSLVDKLYHPMYRSTDNFFGIEMNLENDKSVLFDYLAMALPEARPKISEDEDQLYYEEYHKYKDSDIFMLVKHTFTYEGKKIIKRNVVFEELNHDPSEGQDWN